MMNRVRTSALGALLALALIGSPVARSAGDPARGEMLFNVTYTCNVCHNQGVVPKPNVLDLSAGGSVSGLLAALQSTPLMSNLYANTLAMNPTDLADVAAFIASGSYPPINQQGWTGSWYEAATSGQGVEVEVYPDTMPLRGSIFVSWFTYDTAAGGEDHQRWYTAQGPVVNGDNFASMTIYQNTGGNFNALPVTMAQAVGTATLILPTCSTGQLTYSFTDGTGRIGSIPLTRLLQNVTCSTASPFPSNADFALSGNWFNSATAGQGFTVEVNPISSYLFMAWYAYAPMGAAAGAAGQRWYTAQATFAAGERSIPVTIYETTGGIFDTPTPPGQQTATVGAGTLAFQSCTAATFSYSFTGGSNSGLSGTINLIRVGPTPPGCTS